ncbi:hypothetical protein MKW94_008553 [Papaver nudicaule]|uniref:Uncharacterized protein n=1 Tax=Papaver nudicaule TaxID=74823 RepID=A0AA41S1L1_PAPNU|nr:hypothetical protein [Papaver nudicaule]
MGSEEEQQERKKRRMISNLQLNKMKFENREMKHRLSCVVQNTQLFRRDNDKLQFESEAED